MKEPRKFPVFAERSDAGPVDDSDDSDDNEASGEIVSGSASIEGGSGPEAIEPKDADLPKGDDEVANVSGGEDGTTDEPVAKRKRRERYRPRNVKFVPNI